MILDTAQRLRSTSVQPSASHEQAHLAGRIVGLDSIRAVAAWWVVLSHLGFVPLPEYVTSAESGIWKIVRGLYHCMWSGISAVIVFFLISGLVIHYPQSNGSSPDWRRFLLRRYVRVAIPLIVVVVFAKAFALEKGLSEVLWSLYAELIYYSIYPLLLVLSRRTGWGVLIAVSALVYVALASYAAPGTNYTNFPIHTQWLVGLPCWLAGCALAERLRARAAKPPSAPSLWRWRTALYALTFLSVVGNFHFNLPFLYTQNVFAIFAFLWLERELAHRGATATPPWRLLEWAGAWSYSLYLVHNPIADLFAEAVAEPHGWWWLLSMGSVMGGAYLFHLLVEAPSVKLIHRLKRGNATHTRPAACTAVRDPVP